MISAQASEEVADGVEADFRGGGIGVEEDEATGVFFQRPVAFHEGAPFVVLHEQKAGVAEVFALVGFGGDDFMLGGFESEFHASDFSSDVFEGEVVEEELSLIKMLGAVVQG